MNDTSYAITHDDYGSSIWTTKTDSTITNYYLHNNEVITAVYNIRDTSTTYKTETSHKSLR